MPTAPCLYIQDGEGASTQIDLNHFPFTIGRARECDYVINSHDVSRLHLQIDLHHQQLIIRDMGSTNGTTLNDEPMLPNRDYRLRANDRIDVAGVCVMVFDDPSTTAITPPKLIPKPGLKLDLDAAQVYIGNKRLDPPLSPSQIALLDLLIKYENRVVSRDAVRFHVWGPDEEVQEQTIDALVSRLRKRLSELDIEHDYIVTRRGFGLMFVNRPQVVTYP